MVLDEDDSISDIEVLEEKVDIASVLVELSTVAELLEDCCFADVTDSTGGLGEVGVGSFPEGPVAVLESTVLEGVMGITVFVCDELAVVSSSGVVNETLVGDVEIDSGSVLLEAEDEEGWVGNVIVGSVRVELGLVGAGVGSEPVGCGEGGSAEGEGGG